MNFVTVLLSEYPKNIHLIKDVGLLPYGLYKYHGIDSFVMTYENQDLSYIEQDVKGLKIWPLKHRSNNYFIDIIFEIIHSARSIDILNIYHVCRNTLIVACLYKTLNKDGKIYIKCDGTPINKKTGPTFLIKKKLLQCCDVVSVELENSVSICKEYWNREFIYIPNPYNPKEKQDWIPYSKRSNIILTVGRLGSYQKNTEILIDAFAKLDTSLMDSWELVLVGSIEKSFSLCYDEWCKAHPEASRKIIFTGPIVDRKELFKLYTMSKIFVFPSRFESFGIAGLEAVLSGDYFIGSDIPSNTQYVVNNNGSLFINERIESLIDCLEQTIKNMTSNELKASYNMKFVQEKYDLKKISSTILYKLIDDYSDGK